MKYKILDNVVEYPAEELAEHIRKGIVSLNELEKETDGQFDSEKRKKVENILENGDSDNWTKARQDRTIKAVQHYLDIYSNGKYKEEARSLKKEIEDEIDRAKNATAIDREWESVDKSSIEDLQTFRKKHPYSYYESKINQLINNIIIGFGADSLIIDIKQYQNDNRLTIDQINNNIINTIKNYLEENKISKDDFLNIIKEDKNLLDPGIIRALLKDVINTADLLGIGIDSEFINILRKRVNVQPISTSKKLDRIHKQSTEVYFWGIPASGKSCAIGAILSAAASGKVATRSLDPATQSQGYGYMTKLMNVFQNGKVNTLVEGTSLDSFYEMGFDLIDHDKNRYPFTFVDMAGELMSCMYKKNAGDPLTNQEVDMLDTLTKVLIDNRSTNRKMHVFVVEYGAEDRLYEGLPQKVFLEGAASYINDTGIFKKETYAIFIMITKADKVKNLSKEVLNNYIDDIYRGFYNALEQICIDNEINRGKVEKIAFSLGEVYFQDYCRFNPHAANNVVNILLNKAVSFKGGKVGKIMGKLRS